MRSIVIVLQIILLCGISVLGNMVSQVFHLNIPGNILGLGFLFLLMEGKILSLNWIEEGADFLIAQMLLFFIPSAIGVIQFQKLLLNQLAGLSAVIVGSTLIVVIVVGILTEIIIRCNERREKA